MRKPRIPLTPAAVPTQGTDVVSPIPSLPAGVQVSLGRPPRKGVPQRPRSAAFVGGVEWSWSPMHSRFDAYYLHAWRNLWILWLLWPNQLDEWDFDEPELWEVLAYAPIKGVDSETAAASLLTEAWMRLKETERLDHFHMIDDDGLLSADQLAEIARIVWPERAANR